MGEQTYKVIRFYSPSSGKDNETVKTGLTREEAVAHCSREDTREEGVFFDGWTEE